MNTQTTTNFKTTASYYGIGLGAFLSLMIIFIYAFNLELMTKWWLAIVNFLIVIGIAIVGMAKCKKEHQDLFTYKKAFTSYFIIILIGLTISTITNYLIFSIVDPEAAEFILDKTIEMTRSLMENFGTSEADIDKSIAAMREENQFSLKNQLIGLASNLVIFILIGLLVALGFREKEQNS